MILLPARFFTIITCLFCVLYGSMAEKCAVAQGPSAPAGKEESRAALPRGERLARTALTYRGGRYSRGGSSSSSGFDCAGLTQAVYRDLGVSLPRTPRDQFMKGVSVSRDNLKPGDLVFFSNTCRPGISHVGIYLGDGKFVHASTPSTGIIVSALSEKYYASRYSGARRIEKPVPQLASHGNSGDNPQPGYVQETQPSASR